MRIKLGKILTFIQLLILIVSCGAGKQEASSDVSYGLSPGKSNFLIYKPDGSDLYLCGDDIETLAWAISTWASAIGFQYQFFESCDPNIATVYSYGESDSTKKDECTKYGYENRGYANTSSQPMQVVNCNAWNPGYRFMLHEVGHLFGLCDQYDDFPRNKQYCATQSSTIDPKSVMASANRTDLSKDDQAGIRELYRRVWAQ